MTSTNAASTVEPDRVRQLLERERGQFVATHPRSVDYRRRAEPSMLYGVPMNWMTRWASPSPVVVASAYGATIEDIDGNAYVDLCLGDTGAMAGHGPAPVVAAIAEQMAQGATFMLPTENAIWVAEEMTRRFGMSRWQFCLTASDANRFVLRLARQITGRQKVVIHNWCYHGSVDETLASLDGNGAVIAREGSVGPSYDVTESTRVVEINDLDALQAALADGKVACVLVEPALTNIGIVLPDADYHRELRRITRETGTLLVIDETHTICAGPGGYTAREGLEPDLVTIGKTIGGGVPIAAYGMSDDVAASIVAQTFWHEADVGGVGGTLAGNALSLAAARATLGEVLTEEAFERMESLAIGLCDGIESVIADCGAPWHVTRLGCRAEYLFSPEPPRNGAEAAAAGDEDLDALLHLAMLNRGVLLTPFHNMTLMSPATTADQVDTHTAAFAAIVAELLS
ncbi:MAG TPA: transaminase [Mycobacteriales bacterium]|jgi:glutamate-1-semialdehyde 2,1-aminomutase|nr:transaminase [Mycobacteriales bacterium]